MSAYVAAVDVEVNVPSGQDLLALVPAALLVVGFLAYCLVDLARATSVRCLPKAPVGGGDPPGEPTVWRHRLPGLWKEAL